MLRILISLIIYGLLIAPCSFAKYYNGSSWGDVQPKVWSGSTWTDLTEYRYTGSVWSEVNTGGGSGTQYAGYPTTDGVPDSPSGSFTGYGVAGDRVYTRVWTATESGTANAINIYHTSSLGNSDYSYAVLYRGTTAIGYADAKTYTTSNEWTGYITITAYGGEDLTFSSSDVMHIGFAGDNVTSSGLSYDNGDSTSVIQYSSDAWAVTPPATVSWTTSGTTGLAMVLRYEN